MADITVKVNGDDRKIAEGTLLKDLLNELEVDPEVAVVKVNQETIADSRLGEVTLKKWDFTGY